VLTLSKDFPLIVDLRCQSQTLKFWSSDSEEKYNKNNKPGWEYENSEDLVYEFNEWGYRTKNIDDLDKDFALVFGCSYTEGVGLYQKDIWCEKLCKELGMDVFNLAKHATGGDVCYMNTILYVKNLIKYKPRLVIYQWPQNFRRSFAHEDVHAINPDGSCLRIVNYNMNTHASNEDSNWYKNRWIKEYGEVYRDNFFNFYSVDTLWKALDIPVYHWTWYGDFEKGEEAIGLIETDNLRIIHNKADDRARDIGPEEIPPVEGHDGKQIHSDVVDFLIDDIRKLL
tara:strand:- start:1258 stop:2106 length:849 start_codon:yes stop_codon:yes gene_type:complete